MIDEVKEFQHRVKVSMGSKCSEGQGRFGSKSSYGWSCIIACVSLKWVWLLHT